MKRKMIGVLVVWSPMLIIVDRLHIQHNGFLLGILLISPSLLEEGRDFTGGLVFAMLLCFKHLFAVVAPIYFVYLLRHYCWKGLVRGFWRLSVLGLLLWLAGFTLAYGPFVYHGGLCHAYWAGTKFFGVLYHTMKVLGWVLV
ncbi:hypothetical protein ACFX19_041043 [Malus domestica]